MSTAKKTGAVRSLQEIYFCSLPTHCIVLATWPPNPTMQHLICSRNKYIVMTHSHLFWSGVTLTDLCQCTKAVLTVTNKWCLIILNKCQGSCHLLVICINQCETLSMYFASVVQNCLQLQHNLELANKHWKWNSYKNKINWWRNVTAAVLTI